MVVSPSANVSSAAGTEDEARGVARRIEAACPGWKVVAKCTPMGVWYLHGSYPGGEFAVDVSWARGKRRLRRALRAIGIGPGVRH